MWLLDAKNKKLKPNQWVRMAYAFGREVDDIVDGDVALPEWFMQCDDFLDQVKDDILINTKQPITKLWFHWKHIIKKFLNIWQNLEYDLVDFLEWMKQEYRRRIWKMFLREEELNSLHDKSFRWSQQVYLSALWSRYNASDIKELPQILGWIYWLKDLKSDFNKWIYNIPIEVLCDIWYKQGDLSQIIDSELFDKWISDTISKQSFNIAELEKKIQSMDFWVKKICSSLLPEIHDFIDNFDIESYKREYL